MAAVEAVAIAAQAIQEVDMVVDQGRVALVAGATGLVGQEILAVLLADSRYLAVHCVGRRPPVVQHPKLQFHRVDFAFPADLAALPKVDECYIALGTTINVAGSKEAFRAVDLQAVEALALAARRAGASRLGVVSAMGADTQSRVFYNRVKGEMEVSVARMGYPSLVIARPSLIDGDRAALNQPGRSGEGLGLILARSLGNFIPRNYRAIKAGDIARALVRAVQTGTPGVVTLMSGDMLGS